MTTRFDQSTPSFAPARARSTSPGPGRLLAVTGGLVVAFLVGVGVGGSDQPTVQAQSAAQQAPNVITSTVVAPGPTTTITAAPAPVVAAPVVEAPAAGTSFTLGTYQVGADIQPGNYRTTGGSDCYWERLTSNDGDFNSIIANGFAEGPSSLSVKSSDKYVHFDGSCTWTKS